MRKLALALALFAFVLTAPGAARAQTVPPCAEPVEVVVWTAINWNRVAGAFADDPAPCAEYWVSIPPGLNRTVPLGNVPMERCASGAQCRPARHWMSKLLSSTAAAS